MRSKKISHPAAKPHSKQTIISRLLTLRASLPNNMSWFVVSFIYLLWFLWLFFCCRRHFTICILTYVASYLQIIIVFAIWMCRVWFAGFQLKNAFTCLAFGCFFLQHSIATSNRIFYTLSFPVASFYFESHVQFPLLNWPFVYNLIIQIVAYN